ncbi:MAG: ABC transporter permease [Terracidiphilus sp.]
MNWFASLFRRRRYEDLAASIEEHIAEKAEELIESGMPREQAERAARRAFGNRTVITERSREAWQWPKLESLLADVKLVFRRLRNAPGFAVTVLLTLAIGIGANTAVFTVVNSVLLKPLPYPDSGRLVALTLNAPGAGAIATSPSGLELSQSMYLTFAEHSRSFESMGIWTTDKANVTGLARPEEVNTAVVSSGVLETLDVPAVAGRWFTVVEQDPHGAKAVMLSYGYWQRQFGDNRRAVGRTIQVDGISREIVGVMPRGFRLVDQDFDLLLPMAVDKTQQKLAPFGYDGIARLKPGVTLAAADADVSRLIEVWMDSWSNGPGTNTHYYRVWRIAPAFEPLKQKVIGNVGSVLWVVMATIGLVMLIACLNVANLLLVRADARQRELAVRAALGAGRARIAWELLLESVVLGLLGGVLGIGVAEAALRLLAGMAPVDLPRLSEIALDGWSLAFTLALSVAAGLVFGSIPAFKYGWAQVAASIGTGRTASMSRERHRSRDLLVVGQVALALVLLVCATLMIRTFAALKNVDPGFADAAHVETMRISIPDQLEHDDVTAARMENAIVEKLAAIPGVQSVGFAASFPMEGFDPNADELMVEGKNYQGNPPPILLYNYVSPGYFQTMGTRLVAGRDFTWADEFGMRPMVMVSENFARETWGSAPAAVGKRVKQFSGSPWDEVIGVVENVRQHGVDENAPATIYWPALEHDPYAPGHGPYAVRSVRYAIHSGRAANEGFLGLMQQAVGQVNGDLPVAEAETMQQMYGHSMARTSFTLVMLGIAGAMALLLGVIGIYGVISYAVSQRRREIGIRLALGAQRGELRWMFVRSALVLTGVGVGIGVVAAAGLTQTMKSLLFGVSPADPVSFLAIPLVLAVAAALASYLPARRAASVNPVDALRSE